MRRLRLSSGEMEPEGLPLPPKDRRLYHRIAVAFGGKRHVPVDISREVLLTAFMTHVVDEVAFRTLLRHLDTITDFTKYLTDKEAFLKRKEGSASGRVGLWLGRRGRSSRRLLEQ